MFHIRWMIRRDMPDVMAMELALGAGHWEEEDFLRALRERNTVGIVAEIGENVVAHMIYELHEDCLILVRLVVSAMLRRQGIGRALIAKLQGKLSAHRRELLLVNVPESQLPVQLWLKRLGFTAVAVENGGWEEEDTYRFEYRVDVPTEPVPF